MILTSKVLNRPCNSITFGWLYKNIGGELPYEVPPIRRVCFFMRL